jgi:hypothetical protein
MRASHTEINGICKQNIDKEWRPIDERTLPTTPFSIKSDIFNIKTLPNKAAGKSINKERP